MEKVEGDRGKQEEEKNRSIGMYLEAPFSLLCVPSEGCQLPQQASNKSTDRVR